MLKHEISRSELLQGVQGGMLCSIALTKWKKHLQKHLHASAKLLHR